MKLNKQVMRDLKNYKYNTKTIESPKGQVINHLIIISLGNKEKHDSGYPYIRVFGCTSAVGGKLIELGCWHDHICYYVPVNIDSIGKNIFRVMPWCQKKEWKIKDRFISCSSLSVGNTSDYYKETQLTPTLDKYIIIS